MIQPRQAWSRIRHSLILATLLPLAASPAMAATQWSSYQWQMDADGSPPFPIPVLQSHDPSSDPSPPETSLKWTDFVGVAVNDWSDASELDFVRMSNAGPTSVDNRKCPPPTGTVVVCNKKYGYNGWLGVAQIWTSGNYILKGAVKLNDSYFASSTYNTEGWKSLVACQEIGHTLGLSHDDTTFGNANYGTCMDYTNYPDAGGNYKRYNGTDGSAANNWHPNDNDYGLLNCMYDGTNQGCANTSIYLNSGPTTSGGGGKGGRGNGRAKGLGSGPTNFGIRDFSQAPPANVPSSDPGNAPAEWGTAVAFTADGRGRVFEREIAPGRKIITEVFWAPR